MAQHKVGYIKGLNKDLAKDKYSNQHYFDANNIRVITSGGLSTGSIENEKGNKLLFSFPTVGKRIKINIDFGVSTGSVTINATTVSYDTSQDNESFYNELIGTAAIATLISNNDIYIHLNDNGIYIQILNSATTSSFINTIGTAGSNYSAATSAIYICGWTRLNEWLIVFTSNSETAEPTNALCQIWKFKFQSGSRTLIDGASILGVLDNTEHLIYNDYLNYSTITYIKDTVGNYETSNKGRVYFTDYFNQIRVINIFDEELLSLKPTDLDLIAEVTLSKPLIQIIENNGTLPASAAYQVYYKLLDSDGRETIFSPGSQLIVVNEELSNDTSLTYHQVEATIANSINNKSFTIQVKDIDSDYDVIEYYVAIWTSVDSPSIYKIGEDIISGTEATFVFSSLTNAINIPLVSFMSIGVPFTAKTIEDRDKSLIAANIKEISFDLDFDARAYRFNSSSDFNLFSSDGTVKSFTTDFGSDFTNIPETHDAINPTNDDTNTSYNFDNAAGRQIYQLDGTTIGGEGVNISYTFNPNGKSASGGITELNTVSGTASYSGVNYTEYRVGDTEYSLGELNLDGTNLNYNFEDEFNSTKSTKLNSIFTGLARGEVYRYAIVFFSKQGQRSFAKWIGDIKIPDPSLGNTYKIQDSADATSNTELTEGAKVSSYDIGITFTIDISTIKDQISGFKYVRVKRTDADKTRLGTGVVTNFVNYADGNTDAMTQNAKTLLRKYALNGFYLTNTQESISGLLEINGTNRGDDVINGNYTLNLADHPDILGNKNDYTTLNAYNKYLLNFTAPCSEFRDFTNFNCNTSTDFIRDYGYYSCYEQVSNDSGLNLTASGTNFNAAQLGFLYRAKSFVSLSSEGQTAKNYTIAAQRYLYNGEVIGNYQSALANPADTSLIGTAEGFTTTKIEAITNTSYSFYDEANVNSEPLGLGTKKQFIRLEDTSVPAFASLGSTLNYKQLDNADDIVSGGTDIAAASIDYQGAKRYFKEVAYCRIISNQYGGNTYVARSKNTYIDINHYQIVNNNSPSTFTAVVYGGDTYTVSHSREYMKQYWGEQNPPFKYTSGNRTRFSIGFVFCAECSINTAYRNGEYYGGVNPSPTYNFHGSVDSTLPSGNQGNDETFNIINIYKQQDNLRTDYIAKDFLLDTINKFPNRIKVSTSKVDGELTDNWRQFPVNQFTDVDGSLGEIHKVIAFKNNLFYFQDRGIGILPINERAVVQDVTGASLILGNGDLVGKFQYITETSGTKHQHSVVASDKTLYYYDSLQCKINTLSQESISEQLGISSYFHNDLLEILRDKDELYKANPIGVHAVYDKKNEKIFFTFLGGNVIKDETAGYYDVLDIVLYNGVYYRCLIQGNYIASDLTNTNYFEVLSYYKKGVTISFNEKLNDFESFYDFKPGNYLQFDDKLISIDHNLRTKGYVHEEGDYGKFYENLYSSDIVLVVMPNPNIISIFNNIEYYSEITIDKENVVGETLNTIQLWNNHQNSGKITLTVNTLAKQRIQTWRHKFKRDVLGTSGSFKPRMRNYYLLLKISFENNDNKRLVLSDIVISYTPTKM